MAKNKGRRANVEAQKKKNQESREQAEIQKRAVKELQPESESKKKEVLYQVKTKRDDSVIKAYITFNYRVFHPGVTGRLIFAGILIAAPAIIAKYMWLKVLCLVVGCLLILLGLFRQYISLALTKRNDLAYKNGTEFTYNFTLSDATFYSGDHLDSVMSKYKDITGFYYDDDFYYLGIRNRDFHILPKSRFTIGDPAEFDDFIYKRSRKTCKWIPDNFKDRMNLRRAQIRIQNEQTEREMGKK